MMMSASSHFTNPLLPLGPDPYAIWHEGFYYVMLTEQTRIALLRTPDITNLRQAERLVLYTPPQQGPAALDLWAPELHLLHGRWYVYFTAVDESGQDVNRRIFVLTGPPGSDPFLPEWRFSGQLQLPPGKDRYAIDGTVLQDAGRDYFVWSSKLNYCGGFWQHLLIAELIDPYRLGEQEVILSRPDEPWENHDQPTNEGPQILKHHATLWISYSGSAYWSEHYAIGFLQAQSETDLMNPASWKKMGRPYFKQNPTTQVYGPGHGSFVKSPDGREDWLFYHARDIPRGEPRSPRLQKLLWKDGEPDLGSPAANTTLLEKPSGTAETEI
ncbi:MAG: family 43 glycosylhydrolase [Blastochloris sp.]|nr:family 43 glycosylhydrolase [Blastochloris sp.]